MEPRRQFLTSKRGDSDAGVLCPLCTPGGTLQFRTAFGPAMLTPNPISLQATPQHCPLPHLNTIICLLSSQYQITEGAVSRSSALSLSLIMTLGVPNPLPAIGSTSGIDSRFSLQFLLVVYKVSKLRFHGSSKTDY